MNYGDITLDDMLGAFIPTSIESVNPQTQVGRLGYLRRWAYGSMCWSLQRRRFRMPLSQLVDRIVDFLPREDAFTLQQFHQRRGLPHVGGGESESFTRWSLLEGGVVLADRAFHQPRFPG